MSLRCAILAVSLAALYVPARGIEGDVIASSDFRSGAQNWTLQGSGWSSEGLQSEGNVIAAIDDPSSTAKTWYYAAPKAFLGGDKTLAYNGWLVFDFGHFEFESMGLPMVDGHDILLYGKNKRQTLGLKGVFKSDGSRLSNSYAVRLEESFVPEGSVATWELVNVLKPVNGKMVAKVPTQHEFVSTLQALTGISIRGSYYQGAEASWLKDVKILQGALNKGGEDGDVQTRIKGALVNGSRTMPVVSSDTCCSSRTCVSNDKYEIQFDRPGCMQAPDAYCCMDSVVSNTDTCTVYSRTFDKSKAAEVVEGTDRNEGRPFILPGRVDRCRGAGQGQYGPAYSQCLDDGSVVESPAVWDSATKNQNLGVMAIPIRKPFIKDYYVSSIPRICSAATLTVEVHGDVAHPADSIRVYGEDEQYLGTLFGGNLTYMTEGQRPYDPTGAVTYCDRAYDEGVANSGTQARSNDPHHPTGAIPQGKGFRGGRDDVVTPGVYGNEDTKCTPWSKNLFGNQPLSLEHSDSSPYKDSIAISQDRMMQYSADEQIKFTFRSVRDDSVQNAFSGTGNGGTTKFCAFGRGANDCGTGQACAGCDLDGKVIFRSIRLKFSAGVCYTKKLATDVRFEYLPTIDGPQPLTVGLQYTVPTGDSGTPGGDAVLSVTVGADIFGLDKFISVYDAENNKVGDLFRKESLQGLRSHVTDDVMIQTSSFGASDAPRPFLATTDCDTTAPITNEICTKADNRYAMGSTFVNYTDTLRIPRATVAKMAASGKVQLFLRADSPNNAFSLGAEGSARISPITLAYPLMHCFMKAIKTGPNFGIFLERPQAYYFRETGFPEPAGDVTFFIAASWQGHVRYVTRHAGSAIADKFSYDGVEDGLPVMRVDKDTVADLGTRWVYKNSDGSECCPTTHRPVFANAQSAVSEYSSCLAGACADPHDESLDGSTEAAPAATELVGDASTGANVVELGATASSVDGIYTGMYIYLSSAINAVTSSADGTGCTGGTWNLQFIGGGGTGAAGTFVHDATNVGTITVSAAGTGYTSPPTVVAAPSSLGNAHGCTVLPTFAATLVESYAGERKTIVDYDGATKIATVDSDFSATPAATAYYRVSADAINDGSTELTFDLRNSKDGGTQTGSVAIKLATGLACETRALETGTSPVRLSATLVRLAPSASAANDAYNGLKIRVYEHNTAATSYVTASYTISDYVGVLKGTISAVNAGLDELTLDDPTDSTNIAVANLLTGVTIEVDIDGDPDTADDIYTRTINEYTNAKVATIDSALGATPSVVSTKSTYLVYFRTATLGASATAVAGLGDGADLEKELAANTPDNLGAAASIGATSLDLSDITDVNTATAHYYAGLSVLVTEGGSSDEYQILTFDESDQTVTIDRPTPRAYTTAATVRIVSRYEIYKDLGSGCLLNAALKMTYSYGVAKSVSNDPGELDTIYSAWDTTAGRATSGFSSAQSVRAWVIKLAGDGYFSSIYPGSGRGAFAGTVLSGDSMTAAVADTSMTVADSTGIIVGMYLYISDNNAGNPNEEIVKVVAIDVGGSTTVLTVDRAQLGTQAVAHDHTATYPPTVTGPAGFNRGQGTDQMAIEGGTNRPSSTDDDAYTGLYVTIEAGAGAGQTRLITAYHGQSRTAYVDAPWGVLPDATSTYRIHFTAEVQEFEPTSNIAIATYPRPIKKGYLYKVLWHACSEDIAWADGLNNFMGRDPGSHPGGFTNAIKQGLPACDGQLGLRVPKQGPPTEYKRFEVLRTRSIAGTVDSGTSTTEITLDTRAETTAYGQLVGRQITLTSSVDSIAITAGGSACTVDGLIYFSGGGGSGAAWSYTVNSGAVNTVTKISGGAFYSSTPSYSFSEPACDATLTLTMDNDGNFPATRTIVSSNPGTGSKTVIQVDEAFPATPDNTFFYRIDAAAGVNRRTTIAGSTANGQFYSAYEVDVVREEYPELVQQHKEWPHGYSYMRLHAGEDGEHIANLFLKDYTQFATDSYYTDSVTIPRDLFANYVRAKPNSISGEFPFTINTPPGRSNIEIHSIVIGYPVVKKEDATMYDSTDIDTSRTASHGQSPFFHSSSSWSGGDAHDRVPATHPRFRSHSYTSTCGNGVHDEGEYCDDGNSIDGDGCSSACFLEAGWTCETISLNSPSVCRFGGQGSLIPDMAVGCKMYACEGDADWNTAYYTNIAAADRPLICSGTPRNADGTYDKCLVGGEQGTCTLCIRWDSSEAANGGLLDDSGVAGIDGPTNR